MKNFIIAVIGILIALSIFVLVKNSNTIQKSVSPVSQNKEIASPSPAMDKSLLTYSDTSGFEFQYPKEFSVKKKDLITAQLYSSLELFSTGSAERIGIKAEESSLEMIDGWFKGANKTSVFGEVKKIKLADLDARQFEANNAKTTIALDQGVLFTLTTNAKKDSLLLKAYDTIVKSFKFVQPSSAIQNNSSTASDDYSDVVDEGEEVIE
jgi:hypothetical protein